MRCSNGHALCLILLAKARQLRSKSWWFTTYIRMSHYLSRFAAFVIDARAKISTAGSLSKMFFFKTIGIYFSCFFQKNFFFFFLIYRYLNKKNIKKIFLKKKKTNEIRLGLFFCFFGFFFSPTFILQIFTIVHKRKRKNKKIPPFFYWK